MKHHTIVGGGGTRLRVVGTGNPQGQSVLFIHGFSQCSLCWSRQLDSDLADDYRLVAMDMRGHGGSDRPRDGYDDTRLWADDVACVIRSSTSIGQCLRMVVLASGDADYVRHMGTTSWAASTSSPASRSLGVTRRSRSLSPEVPRACAGFLLERCRRECPKPRRIVANVLRPRARDTTCMRCSVTTHGFRPTFGRVFSHAWSTMTICFERSARPC